MEGLVLDLRFASGTNYAAAARLAGQFMAEAVPLMSLGAEEYRAPGNAQPFPWPVMVLVNRRTSGAAEALAEALRQNQVAMLLGGRTAGTAGVFEEFPLSTGQRLRVVTATVKLRDGAEVPPGGVEPDITVTVPLAEERAFLENPFASARSPNASGRPARLTEADLVRMRRERRETPTAAPAETTPAVEAPVVADPALARALDLLKGIALVRPPRRL
jgi:C-terminal processing protease CtpA/Prc